MKAIPGGVSRKTSLRDVALAESAYTKKISAIPKIYCDPSQVPNGFERAGSRPVAETANSKASRAQSKEQS